MDLCRLLFLLLVIFTASCRGQGGIFGFLTRLFGGIRRTTFVYPTSSITTYSYPSPDDLALAAAHLPAILPTVTETVTVTDIFTSISVQQELVTLPAWIRWQTITESVTFHHSFTETTTSLSVSVLVSVHVLTVTESTSNVWTAISTTTLYSELNDEAAGHLKRPATVTTTQLVDRTLTSLKTVIRYINNGANCEPQILIGRDDETENLILNARQYPDEMEDSNSGDDQLRQIGLLIHPSDVSRVDSTSVPKTDFWARYGKQDYEDDDITTTNVYPTDVDNVQPSYDIDSRLTVWHPTVTEVEPSYETDTRLVVWN